jgi:hypothetical protein
MELGYICESYNQNIVYIYYNLLNDKVYFKHNGNNLYDCKYVNDLSKTKLFENIQHLSEKCIELWTMDKDLTRLMIVREDSVNIASYKQHFKIFNNFESFEQFIHKDFVSDIREHLEKHELIESKLEDVVNKHQGLEKEVKYINGVLHRNFIRLRKYIECINEELKTAACDIQQDLRVLQKREYKPLKINDELHRLTPQNLLDECVAFFNSNTSLCSGDVVSTIKHMLNTKQFILSDEFKKSKLDLQDISFQYKVLTNPQEMSREEVIDAVFNVNNSELI